MPSTSRKFFRHGPLAINPKALSVDYAELPVERVNTAAGEVAVIDVCGPLVYVGGFGWQGYDEVRHAVTGALASSARAVVMRIDSPGGEVAGAFETARALRVAALASSKPLIAYTTTQATSSAYALASAAGRIVVSDVGFVGSIGVIDTVLDVTAADVAQGLKFAVVSSGARKTDGHPHVAITADAVVEFQATVDSLAGVFFQLVATHRPQLTPERLRALNASVFHGGAAVAIGLADEVSSWDDLMASIGRANTQATVVASTEPGDSYDMPKPDEDEKNPMAAVMAALSALATGEDAEAASKAKKALAALVAAEEEPEPPPEKPDPEPPAASAALAPIFAQLKAQAAEVSRLRAESDATSRANLLASRPDLDPAIRKLVESQSLEVAREMIAAIPKPANPAANSLAARGTQGNSEGGRASMLAPEERQELNRRMGLVKTNRVIEHDGAVMRFGVVKEIS